MKKTWTTRILIALMTLAIVGGVFGVAPRGAQADEVTKITIPSAATLTRTTPTQTLTASFEPTGADTPTLVWSSDTPGVVSVDSATGALTAVSGGTAKITAAFTNATSAQVKSNECIVTVTPSITVSLGSSSIAADSSTTVTANPWPRADSVQIISATTANVTINGTTATGVAPGMSVISASMSLNGVTTASEAASNPILTVTSIKSVITPPSNFSIEKGKTVTLSATSNNGTDDISWSATSGSFNPATTKSGGTTTYTAPSTGTSDSFKLTQTVAAGSKYSAADEKTVSVTLTDTVPTVTISPASASISYPNGSQAFTATSTSPSVGTTFTWYVDNVATGTTGPNYTYTPSSTGSHKVKVTATCTGYETTSKEATVTVSARMDLGVSSISTKVGATDTSFNVTTSGTTTISATSANTGIATVTPSSIAGNVTNTFTVKPIAAGDTTITISDGTTSKSIPVHVAGAYPVITTSFNANTIGGNSLSKVYAWGQLTIRVKDYNPAIPYVTVTRSNIRTYMLGGSYYTHPSTYTYTAYLTQDGNDGVASPSIVAQYNGSTYYTVAYTGASNVNSTTIYVTGFTTLPQTGPDYTWAYVLGGLCLITVATAVTLNVRKKKRESI